MHRATYSTALDTQKDKSHSSTAPDPLKDHRSVHHHPSSIRPYGGQWAYWELGQTAQVESRPWSSPKSEPAFHKHYNVLHVRLSGGSRLQQGRHSSDVCHSPHPPLPACGSERHWMIDYRKYLYCLRHSPHRTSESSSIHCSRCSICLRWSSIIP